ncbi:DUF5134 domain-containing protein [Amycolatopsis sp. CA-230715]|uniref:DUF5134 domain-containing protein n=1 Tax=Amycolatopsis sp. CA-230715 TaxID=2745196 RepID=UPI001C0204C7|nr:DUF5134 domain-containing protein [Amycolatopsis sp. CA-230715]QWF85271.1 hypothetical protein HUW46_08725 [Amycolatopsis sp. CA-230715]
MIAELGLRWILTAVFVATGAFCGYRCLRHGTPAARVSDVLHVIMCAGMVAMAWPAAMTFARIPQTVLFAAAAAWFAGALILRSGDHDDHRGTAHAHHALMMAGMAWMVFMMPSAMSGMVMSAPEHGGEHAGMAMGDGMTMSGSAPPHVAIVAGILAVLFLVAGTGWLARAIDLGRADHRPDLRTAGLAAEGAMSLGMAVMALAMI